MLSNNFVMVACVAGQVSVERLRLALSQIHLTHPVLARTGAAAVFPLQVQTGCVEDAWIALADTELGLPFAEGAGAGARFHLLQHAAGFSLVGCFDHGLCEGMSGIYVFRDILRLVGDPTASLDAIAAAPVMDHLIPRDISSSATFRFKLGLGMALVRGYLLLGKVRDLLLPPATPSAARSCSTGAGLPLSSQFVVLPTRLTVEQTSALVARCKRERVSVHAAVSVAWLRALHADQKPGCSNVGRVSSPVDLRQRAATPIPETSGRYMTLVETSVEHLDDPNFWDVVRRFKQQFNAALRPQELYFRPAMLTKILASLPHDDIKTLMLAIFGGEVKHDFSISNLGRVPMPQRIGALQVKALYGLVNASPFERTVVAITLAGQMNIAFVFRKSMMDAQAGQRLMDRAMLSLRDAATLS